MSAGFYNEICAASGTYKAYWNGEWRISSSGKTVAIQNPTTRETAFTVQGKVLLNHLFALSSTDNCKD